MTPVHYTTTDLYEAAYLMVCGCVIEGITKLSPYSSAIVFSRKDILSVVDCYKSYRHWTAEFSPKAYGEKREELKRPIKMQPTI